MPYNTSKLEPLVSHAQSWNQIWKQRYVFIARVSTIRIIFRYQLTKILAWVYTLILMLQINLPLKSIYCSHRVWLYRFKSKTSILFYELWKSIIIFRFHFSYHLSFISKTLHHPNKKTCGIFFFKISEWNNIVDSWVRLLRASDINPARQYSAVFRELLAGVARVTPYSSTKQFTISFRVKKAIHFKMANECRNHWGMTAILLCSSYKYHCWLKIWMFSHKPEFSLGKVNLFRCVKSS